MQYSAGEVMRHHRRESAAVQHFRTLHKPTTKREVLRALKTWIDDNNICPITVGRSMRRFASGAARTLSDEISPPFIEFCREGLHLDVRDDEFDIEDRFSDHLGEFARRNRLSRSLLEEACGDYVTFRPRLDHGQVVNDGEVKRLPASIYEDGSTGRFGFSYENDKRQWEGHALSSGRYIYLVGFETNHQDAIFMILCPLDHDGETDVLVGCQVMRWDYPDDGILRETAVGRPMALVRVGARQRKSERDAQKWLAERGAKPGMVIDLAAWQTVLSETAAG